MPGYSNNRVQNGKSAPFCLQLCEYARRECTLSIVAAWKTPSCVLAVQDAAGNFESAPLRAPLNPYKAPPAHYTTAFTILFVISS